MAEGKQHAVAIGKMKLSTDDMLVCLVFVFFMKDDGLVQYFVAKGLFCLIFLLFAFILNQKEEKQRCWCGHITLSL